MLSPMIPLLDDDSSLCSNIVKGNWIDGEGLEVSLLLEENMKKKKNRKYIQRFLEAFRRVLISSKTSKIRHPIKSIIATKSSNYDDAIISLDSTAASTIIAFTSTVSGLFHNNNDNDNDNDEQKIIKLSLDDDDDDSIPLKRLFDFEFVYDSSSSSEEGGKSFRGGKGSPSIDPSSGSFFSASPSHRGGSCFREGESLSFIDPLSESLFIASSLKGGGRSLSDSLTEGGSSFSASEEGSCLSYSSLGSYEIFS
mmetsp:Transcript_33187/g.37738  ORF Transcript_33187/g.37738 Transcript_33187/m.37738 type:complete len:253 (-) Transcript_33187:301-1059(-)